MTDYTRISVEFQERHIVDTILGMAGELRRYADTLERVANREGSRPGWRASEAWSEIRSMNSNLRVDVLFSSLDSTIELLRLPAPDPKEEA